jgi:hypothetical protein
MYEPIGLLLIAMLIAAIAIGVRLAQRRGLRARAVAALKSCGLCPQCCYSLRLSTEDIVVCPECGAAWRLEKNETGRP